MTDNSTGSTENDNDGGRFSRYWKKAKGVAEPTYWWGFVRDEPLKPEEVQLWHKLAFGAVVVTGVGIVVACPLLPSAFTYTASGYALVQHMLWGDGFFAAVHDSLPQSIKYLNTAVAFGLVAVSLGSARAHAGRIVTVGADGLRVVRTWSGVKCGWHGIVSAMRAKSAFKKARAL